MLRAGFLIAACLAPLPVFAATPTASPGETIVRQLPGADSVIYTLYPPNPMPKGKAGLVVHFYGTGGTHENYNIGRPPYAEMRRLLAERGYWIAVPNLGPLHWMNDAACASVDALIAEMIKTEHVDPARVDLFGTSMGGASTLIYITRRPGKIKAAVALFPITDFNQWLEEMPKYRAGIEKAYAITPDQRETALRGLSPLQHLDAFRQTSLFLLHGDADPTVLPHHSRNLAAALKGKGYPVIYREAPGLKHNDEIARPYQQELADFLTEANSSGGAL